MLFNSEIFIAFAMVFFPVYFLLPYRAQLLWILFMSYLFYAWWDWRFCLLMATSTLVNYAAAILIGNSKNLDLRRKLLWAIVAFDLLLLGIFKYFNFFYESLEQLADLLHLHAPNTFVKLALPVGLSFYTFHSLSYVIDVYQRRIATEKHLSVIAVYIALWPQLVAGPIMRAHRLRT
jgi:alginate O-acetyltransferase complex protein AlgI